jgi:hypothetical protein
MPWRNPLNGRVALYIASHAYAIDGFSDAEARTSLDELIAGATRPEFTYQHRWRRGDVLMWNNRATMHRGRPWPHNVPRSMVRTTISPVGADGLAEVRPPKDFAQENRVRRRQRFERRLIARHLSCATGLCAGSYPTCRWSRADIVDGKSRVREAGLRWRRLGLLDGIRRRLNSFVTPTSETGSPWSPLRDLSDRSRISVGTSITRGKSRCLEPIGKGGRCGHLIEVVEHARALNELIRRDAPQSERLGRLTDKVAAALLDANLFSTLLPQAAGGFGAGRAEFFETVEEISRADGSAGWRLRPQPPPIWRVF